MKTRKLLWILIPVLVLATVIVGAKIDNAAATGEAEVTPQVEVVFVLDTTGSMSGLIEGAKLKIWSIANQIVQGSPRPDLKVGLVGYRDKGDEYVTRVFDLSTDLDQVYADLMSFSAGGGGDGPEHVNRALHDALNDVAWSADGRTLRIMFLVGDAPPHTDYNDGYDYKAVCEAAVRNDIIINTIQCGQMSETVDFWQEIARLGEGEYAAIPQTGGMRSIPTPLDEEISRLSADLDATVLAWGDEEQVARKEKADKLAEAMPAEAKASRTSFRTISGRMGTYDLIGALEAGDVDLNKIEVGHLPPEMRKMSVQQKREYIEQKKGEREKIRRKINRLNRERDAFIKAKLAEAGTDDSFDANVLTMIRAQASSKGITY